ncbi:MAG TPA: CBS domain-containing protein [Stellaceae bacterium]|nr:CBS domain-containing protein [Stellaceae bacterium]
MRRMSELVRHQDPVVLRPTATVRQACERMRARGIGAVLVTTKDGQLVGIFTGRDAVGRVLAEGRDAAKTTLAEVMTAEPHTMAPDQTAIEALRMMQDRGFRHLPIVKDDRVLGVVSRGDFRGLEQDRLEEETVLWERI